MSLTREATVIKPGYQVGDVKLATYDITFTAHQLVEPSQDPGWFLLNGAVISQTTYPVLFARYGTTFNTGGEGTGNFRLPSHAEGVFPIGKGLTNFTSYGGSGGEITHALTSPGEIPSHGHSNTLGVSNTSHNHSGSLGADNGGAHTHSYTHGTVAAFGNSGATAQIGSVGTLGSNSGSGSHAHTVSGWSIGGTTETVVRSGSLGSAGSSTAHNNMMPYLVIGGLLVKYG